MPPGISGKLLRQQRLRTAMSELDTLESELAFEQIDIHLSDGDCHWQFMYGGTHLADYWPASAKGQITGQPETVACGSAAQAQKLAICAKKRLFTGMALAMQGT